MWESSGKVESWLLVVTLCLALVSSIAFSPRWVCAPKKAGGIQLTLGVASQAIKTKMSVGTVPNAGFFTWSAPGDVVSSFDSPGPWPSGLAWDGTYLWNADAGTKKIYKLEVAAVNTPPTASFTLTPGSPTTDDTVYFTDASTDSDGSVVSWSWDFEGDGAEDSSEQNPTYSYPSEGTYTVTLTVIDDGGATDNYSQNINVRAEVGERPSETSWIWVVIPIVILVAVFTLATVLHKRKS